MTPDDSHVVTLNLIQCIPYRKSINKFIYCSDCFICFAKPVTEPLPSHDSFRYPPSLSPTCVSTILLKLSQIQVNQVLWYQVWDSNLYRCSWEMHEIDSLWWNFELNFIGHLVIHRKTMNTDFFVAALCCLALCDPFIFCSEVGIGFLLSIAKIPTMLCILQDRGESKRVASARACVYNRPSSRHSYFGNVWNH